MPNNKWVGDNIKEITSDTLIVSQPLFNSENDLDAQWIDNSHYLINSFSVGLSNGQNFYLVSSLNRDIISKQINETIFVMFIRSEERRVGKSVG